jgi:hypothetical protein
MIVMRLAARHLSHGVAHSLRQRLPGVTGMADCLHCDINELVRERIEGHDNVDLADLVVRMAESLAETIMLAPKEQWGELMAEAIRHLGNTVIADVEGGADTAH